MIKLSKEDISEAEIWWKLGLLHQAVKQVVNAEEKFLKGVKNATSVNTWMIRKWNNLIDNMEKVLMIWVEDRTSYISWSQSLIQSRALSLFNSLKTERDEEAAEEKFEARRHWFMRLRKESISIT